MVNKRIALLAIGIISLLSLCFIYWFYFSKPDSFPSDEQIVEQMNQIFPKAGVKTIQDTIEVDYKHVFVPFTTRDNNYGTSYWVWEKRNWKPAYINTVGEPLVWKVSREDPFAAYIVWNLHPDDQIDNADFYLVRDRGYHITNGEHTYIPRIEMKINEELAGKSYGVLELPDEWRSFMTKANKLALAQNPTMYWSSLIQDPNVYIGWDPVDEKGQSAFPTRSVNGSGYSNGHIETSFISLINENDLEYE